MFKAMYLAFTKLTTAYRCGGNLLKSCVMLHSFVFRSQLNDKWLATQQRSSCEASSRLANQQIIHLLWNSKIRYHVN